AGELPGEQAICFQVPRAPEEFYDLEADPFEQRNLIDDDQYRSQIDELRSVLAKWTNETGDEVPKQRRPDGFDLLTGERLKNAPEQE
ncbi:MAG TPA: heparan N-sulfatase, partial [Planctomycetaceae bacterium]|nr:heparan N-sulfatase [Planctomycetaceae bacterium]